MKKLLFITNVIILGFVGCNTDETIIELGENTTNCSYNYKATLSNNNEINLLQHNPFYISNKCISACFWNKDEDGNLIALYLSNKPDSPIKDVSVLFIDIDIDKLEVGKTYTNEIHAADFTGNNGFYNTNFNSVKKVTITKIANNKISGTYLFDFVEVLDEKDKITVSGIFTDLPYQDNKNIYLTP